AWQGESLRQRSRYWGEGAGVPVPRSGTEGRLPRRRLRFRQWRLPQEAVRNVRRKLGTCLPAGREDPSPRGPFGEAGGPEGGVAPEVDEHHHLFRAIRLPGEYGWGRC